MSITRTFLIRAGVAVTIGLLAGAGVAEQPTEADVATLLARHVTALGGLENIDAIETLRATGTFRTPILEQALPFVQEQMVPDQLRFESMGGAMVLAADGDDAWELDPERGAAHRLPTTQGRRYQRQAQIGGPLVRAHRAGLAITLTGRAQRDGTSVYVLEARYPDGDRARFYLDATRHLLVGFDDVWRIEGQEVEIQVTLADYRPVAGVLMPFEVEQRTSQGWRRFVFTRFEANPLLDAARFAFPRP